VNVSSTSIRAALPEELDEVIAIDDDATQLYAQAGIRFILSPGDAFVVAEQARWGRAAEAGRLLLATTGARPVGFASLDVVDGLPYLDQLSVRTGSMRKGIGRMLLEAAVAWARRHGGGAIQLTTYDHLPWNRPFYEHAGFVVVPEAECGPGLRHHLEEQRRWLPLPAERVALRRRLADPSD
jgi:GNAT superfamily N-acetyltransferase